MGKTDDETRNAVAEMALRDAAKDMAAPQPADRDVTPSTPAPMVSKIVIEPETVQRDTRRDPVDPIATEIAAIFAQSRTRAPSALSGDLARARLTAADLEQLAAWVSDVASSLLDLEAKSGKLVQFRA